MDGAERDLSRPIGDELKGLLVAHHLAARSGIHDLIAALGPAHERMALGLAALVGG